MPGSGSHIEYTFRWPAGPKDVVVTGDFDEWKGTTPLSMTTSGDFELTVPVTVPPDKQKVFFKFIVDGNWVTSDAYAKSSENGFENNYFSVTETLNAKQNNQKFVLGLFMFGGLVFCSRIVLGKVTLIDYALLIPLFLIGTFVEF